ncbi:MAG: LamG domain-containing protein, partial [Armatimonadetes bacterium]|nr:LamG domain-containing protein [Armatimonadota bacterium]
MRSSRPKLTCPVVLFILITVAAVLLAGRARRSFAKEVGPSKLDKPLIAHWTFDEQFGVTCRDSSGNGCDAAPERKESPGFERIQGVFGDALSFSVSHLLRIPDRPEFGVLKQISLSAWVMPTELSEYREIFRKEDSGNRVLFSFQNNGSLLSLGLNINGYVECDAPIEPEQVLDGKWHHCAATFDGKFMRVYMDGKEIGSMERPGVIAAGGAAPGCIGSSSGGENFQGAMDDLRLYAEALSAEEIEGIYRSGTESLVRSNEDLDAGEPKMGSSLLAHWRFNEPGSGGTIHEASGTPGLEIRASSPVPRRRGVFGKALDLRGTYGLEANLGPRLGEVSKITFSAWTKPSDLSGYREIFRQECGDRLLFSFQEGGSILSLGLNVGGYVECDAKIEASQVLDGRWHHCAGTFDGEFMRVYLDGKEIGKLERPGNLAVEFAAPGFIGSSSGTVEHFQGALDDLRIYGEALSPAQIASLYGSGVESLEGYAREIEKRIDTVYSPQKSFAEALALCRRNLAETSVNLDRDLIDGVVSKLRDSFPEDYSNFTHCTGGEVVEYLMEQESDLQLRDAGRLMDLLLEYKPLTEDQLKKETPEERKRWDEAEAIHQRFEDLKARGDKAEFSPEWIDLMLEAGKRIQFRPVINEAVAPYVRPQTPTTRNLSRAEGRAALERDWLHQANSSPTPERIKDEIKWTRQLAKRIALAFPGAVNLAKELQQLSELEKQTASLAAPDPELYFKVREVKRRVVFRNPVVDFDKVLFVDMPFPQGSEWRHQTRHRLGYMAVPGGRLLTLEG